MMLIGAGSASADTYTSIVDFESAASTYSDWEFDKLVFPTTVSGISAHGGSKFAETNGSSTAFVKTKDQIANPVSIVFYYTKSSTNTNSSSKFKIQVSSNGESWTDVATGKGMNEVTKGTWEELSADLSNYQNVYVRVYYDGTSAKRDIDDITLTYTSSSTQKCATPTFSPAAGAVFSGSEVSINCSTDDVTIYYTTDNTTPTSSSSVYSSPIEITEVTTIKAYAVKDGYDDSDVATAEYTIREVVSGYNIDFESPLEDYVDWTFENVRNTNTAITAHGGNKYGANINESGNATQTASIQTNELIALPGFFTCYFSKTSGNTTSSNWKIQVSEDNSTWTDAATHSATSMLAGSWVEFSADLSQYSDVYVRLYYTGTNAIRTVDDISLTMRDPNAKTTPTVTVDGTNLTTDLAGQTNVAAGTATVTVTSNGSTVENVSVTWTSSDTGVATIDAATGSVTLIATGTTTLTATFAGNDDYNEASGTYQLTVIDSEGPGSENHPYTVAQALENTPDTGNSSVVYVKGIVSGFYNDGENILADYSHRYYISDDGTSSNTLMVYNGKGLGNVAFSNADDVLIGDEVVICGMLTNYNGTKEFAKDNYIVSLDRKEVKFYLAGSWGENNYGWGEGKEQLTKSGNTYTIDKNLANGTLFKIVKVDETNGNETTWYGGPADGDWFGVSETVCENLTLSSSGKNFKIDGACDDHFTFMVDATNPDNLTLTVTGWHVPEVKYYLAGNWSENWDDGKVELTANADGTFSTSKLVGNGSRFKFVKTVDGAETWYGATQSGDDYGINSGWCTNIGLSDAGNSSAFVIQMASDNELVFKLNPTNMTFNVTGWPISIEGNMFVKVTSDADFTDGAYLIVNEEAGVAFDGGLDGLGDANNIISVTIANDKIAATDANKAALFTIVNGGKITSASGHYIGVSDYSNSLKVDGNATMYENSVSIENGNADIAIYTGTSGYVHLKYNKASDQNRFRYYKSGQQPIQLYKLVTLPMNDIVITSAEWATYVPNLAVTIPEDVTAYIVTNATSTSVTLSSVASAPANTGLVVNGDEGTYTPTAAETTDDVSDNLLVVSDGTVVGNGNIYALGNKNGSVGFKKVKSGVTVPAGKPYLTIENTGSKDFFDFSFDEGVATGIESIESIGFDMNAPVYDLQGRQVNRLHKGVFIQNGKKIIVK